MNVVSPKATREIVPSLLAADPGRLEESVIKAKAAGARWISVDVMDGHFVPNLSFGPEHVRMVKRHGVFVDAHLMVSNPEICAPWFVKAGADIVTVHYEACRDARRTIKDIRALGAKPGLAIKPQTDVKPLLDLLPEIQLALVMTVEPGFGGAQFLDAMLTKVQALRSAIDAGGYDCWLQVDGGINAQTIESAVRAGADSLVAGSAVFGASDIGAAFRALEQKAKNSKT